MQAALAGAAQQIVMVGEMSAREVLVAFCAGACAVLFAGCSFVYSRLAYDFVALPENPQILYELGAEDLAKLAAAELSMAMDEVENRQFLPFKDRGAIRIYVFNDRDRYANFSHASVHTRASSATDEVYLSQKLRERINTFANILVHELSHVHVRQYTGTLRYVTDLPGWFLEGLAVSVSSGGGAEDVTPMQAETALRRGVRFHADDSGSIMGHKTAHSYSIEPHMYYRQAALFVEYLQNTDPGAFEQTFVDIIKGTRFREAWLKHYRKTIRALWNDFESTSGHNTTLQGTPASGRP